MSRRLLCVLSFMLLGLSGCGQRADSLLAQEGPLRIITQTGNPGRAILIQDDVWYQAAGSSVIMLDPMTGRVLGEITLGNPGFAAPVSDLLLYDDAIYAVMEDAAVVRLARETGGAPGIRAVRIAEGLRVQPRRLSTAGGDLFVTGRGGAVRLFDNDRVFTHDADVECIRMSADGLVACAGRRIYRLEDHAYLGSASRLEPMRFEPGFPSDASFAFSRLGEGSSTVGLMGHNFRELDAQRLSMQLDELVHALRVEEERIWLCAESGVFALAVRDDALEMTRITSIINPRAIALLDEHHLAICGDFGHGLFDLESEIWVWRTDGLGTLTHADFDGSRIRASGTGGTSVLSLDGKLQSISHHTDADQSPFVSSRNAITLHIEASIDPDGQSVTITKGDAVFTHYDDADAPFHCIAAVEGRYWLGHARGITVLAARGAEPARVIGRLRLDGPVIAIFPLPRGGAAYVCQPGIIGIAELIRAP